MNFGQVYKGKGNISDSSDYVLLNICGLNPVDVVQRYFFYNIDKPIVLLGDYRSKKRSASEDDMLHAERIYEIKDMIKSLMAFGAKILGVNFYPVSRKGLEKLGNDITFKEYADKLSDIYQVPVLFSNSSSKELLLSEEEEVIEFTKTNNLSLDYLSIFKSLNHDRDRCKEFVSKLNIDNVKELNIRYANSDKKESLSDEEMEVYNQSVLSLLKFAKGKILYVVISFDEGSNHLRFEKAIKLANEYLDDR